MKARSCGWNSAASEATIDWMTSLLPEPVDTGDQAVRAVPLPFGYHECSN
ncbi:hypothetical protein VQ056_31205 [Paenibacillus sp. JTLBN-2024]